MPSHARGVKYFSQVSGFLKCPEDHDQIASNVYSEIVNYSNYGYRSVECVGCGAIIDVSVRYGGEWDTQIFPGRRKEG